MTSNTEDTVGPLIVLEALYLLGFHPHLASLCISWFSVFSTIYTMMINFNVGFPSLHLSVSTFKVPPQSGHFQDTQYTYLFYPHCLSHCQAHNSTVSATVRRTLSSIPSLLLTVKCVFPTVANSTDSVASLPRFQLLLQYLLGGFLTFPGTYFSVSHE